MEGDREKEDDAPRGQMVNCSRSPQRGHRQGIEAQRHPVSLPGKRRLGVFSKKKLSIAMERQMFYHGVLYYGYIFERPRG